MGQKGFKLEDVLATYTGIMLSSGGLCGIHEVIDCLIGEELFTHLNSILRKQVVFLNDPDFDFDVGRLKLLLESESNQERKTQICRGWISEQRAKHGDNIMLSPSPGEYEAQNPI